MIAASFISIGDSCADSKGNLSKRQCFRKVCQKITLDGSSQHRGKLHPATPATDLRRKPDPLAEVLRERFAPNHAEWSPAPSCAARLSPLVSFGGSTRSSPVTRGFCARCGNLRASRLSHLHKRCRSLAARRRPRPTFPKFGPRRRNHPRTDPQGKRSSGRASPCGFGIWRS
jgi:hypothetical protein